MIVVRGKNGGFCFGVKRAVEQAKKLNGKGNYVLGEIIHNEEVVKSLTDAGIITINDINDVEFNSGDKLLIRTHGEAEKVFLTAKEKNVEIIDCTCPFVKDIQNIVKKHFTLRMKF